MRAISGSWVVPTTLPSVAERGAAEWIGIGGGSPTASGLIQTGTDQETEAGRTTDSAWYEILPAPAVTVVDPSTGQRLPVAPGDRMQAQIAQARTGAWRIDIGDVTQGWTASGTFSYTGTTSTAEWIVEAPTVRAQIETLADFQSVRFTDMGTTPATALLQPVDMVTEQGAVVAHPGAVTAATTRAVSIYYGAPGTSPPTSSTTTAPAPGYDLVSADGDVFAFEPPRGSAGYFGSLPDIHVAPNAPVVGIVATTGDMGYLLVGADGGVFAFGDAGYLGSLPGEGVRVDDIVGMATVRTDRGYYLVGADGGVFAFGDAGYLGSLPGEGVRADDIVGMAAMPSATGYWLVASTGKVYAFGAAPRFAGVDPGTSPVTGITATRTGGGYWTVTANGAVEAVGNAENLGTLLREGVEANRAVVALVPTPGTGGYWLIGADGGVFAFGDADFVGSLPGITSVDDIVGGIATTA